MSPWTRGLATAVVATCLGGCASTTVFVSTWKSPEVAASALDGQRVATFLISDNEGLRRTVEDALAREATARGAEGVAGYTLMPAEVARQEAAAEEALKEAGVVAVITLRLVSEDQRASTTSGTWHMVPAYRYWGGYWRRGWREVYEPGYTRHDTVVLVETLVYTLDSGGLIWAGMSETTNPEDAEDLVGEIAAAVDDAMKKSGLLR